MRASDLSFDDDHLLVRPWADPVVDASGRVTGYRINGSKQFISTGGYADFITVLADAYQGKRLNSPNDIVVKSDGSVWFTDPSFGIRSYYEGL